MEEERVEKRQLKIATFTIIVDLRSVSGKERESITEFEQANLHILGITETKKKE